MYFNSKLPLYIVLGPAIIHAPYVSPGNPSQRGRQGSINSKTTSHAFFGVVTFMLSTTQRHPERGRGSVSGRALDFGRCEHLWVRIPPGTISIFDFPPSASRLGNQRPWYVQPRLCDGAYKRSRATYQKEKGIVSGWSVSS